MIISMIAAVSENNIIGQHNKLVWKLPTDTQYYKDTVRDKTIIMGRKTAESPDMFFSQKRNILITRKENYQKENFEVTSSLEEALKLPDINEEVFITGGGEIYKIGMEIADKLFITRVHTKVAGDTHFPEINPKIWKITSARKFEADEKNEYGFSFMIYERIQEVDSYFSHLLQFNVNLEKQFKKLGMQKSDHEAFMQMAIALAVDGVKSGEGGPFGAIVVKDGKIVGRGNNQVTSTNDPTAHAEVVAIRDACKNLSTFQLGGCTIYTSCEPCPMCLGAIYWARPDQLFYACTKEDASENGFDDSFIYKELDLGWEERKIPTKQISRQEGMETFLAWRNKIDKKLY